MNNNNERVDPLLTQEASKVHITLTSIQREILRGLANDEPTEDMAGRLEMSRKELIDARGAIINIGERYFRVRHFSPLIFWFVVEGEIPVSNAPVSLKRPLTERGKDVLLARIGGFRQGYIAKELGFNSVRALNECFDEVKDAFGEESIFRITAIIASNPDLMPDVFQTLDRYFKKTVRKD